MEPSLVPLASVLDLNTRLFRACLAGVGEEEALDRVAPDTNHMAFLAVHLVGARALLLSLVGRPTPDPFQELVGDAGGIDDVPAFPSLAEIRPAWDRLARALGERLETVEARDLQKPSPTPFPVGDATVLGGVAFLVQHESYHVGQMALVRKALGHEAMRYAGGDGWT